MQEFVCYNIKFRSKYDFGLNGIANMDETPLYLNMPRVQPYWRLDLIKVNIGTQGQESWRVTAILTVLTSREKLPPLLIFKANKGKDTEKKLQS